MTPARPDPPATVVVSRAVSPDSMKEATALIDQLRARAAKAPGFLGASPLEASEPDVTALAYRFSSTSALDAWLSSPQRQELLGELDPLLSRPAVEQRLVDPTDSGVTLVSSVVVRPGAEDEHRRRHADAVAEATAMGGLMRAELLPAVPGHQRETVAVLTFADDDALERWMRSDTRRRTLEDMTDLIEGDRQINTVGGFAGWFPASSPTQWKQALVVFIALVPTAIVTSAIRQAAVPDMPPLLSLTVVAGVNVVILTWLLMPWLTRLLRPWLER